jgi:rod shape-determining protein MreD
MIAADVAKVGALMFLAALFQSSIVGALEIVGGTADLVLVALAAVALLRGSIYGAGAGFFAGLVLDTANLATLGQSSFLLTIAGYWIGRYGETTGRDRSHAPLLSVAVITVLYALAALALHVVLGDPVDARLVLVDALLPAILLNLVLTIPVYGLTKRILGPPEWKRAEVRLLG